VAIDDGRTSPPVPNLLRRFWSALTAPSTPAGTLVTAPAADLANAGQLLIASLVEAMPYPAIALDGKLRVLAFNPAARTVDEASKGRLAALVKRGDLDGRQTERTADG